MKFKIVELLFCGGGVERKEGDKFNKYLMAVAIYFIIVFYFKKIVSLEKKRLMSTSVKKGEFSAKNPNENED